MAAQDTTEINFVGREERRRGLGPAGDGVSAGFFLHPVIAIDSETEAALGAIDAKIWTRSDGFDPTSARERALEDKESVRWLEGASHAADLYNLRLHLTDAASVVVVADREGDIYAGFARRPASIEMIVRAAQDRVLDDGRRLFAAPEAWPELVRSEVRVAPSRTGIAARVATVALRAGTVTICRPRHGGDAGGPAHLTLTMVEAREVDWNGEGTPLLWRLLTTIETIDADGAAEIVRLYRLRWRIEEVFRSLKSDGLRLEETQMQDARRLFKLALIGLAAATRTIQLVDARDGRNRPATDVIDPGLLPAADAIAPTLEGKTLRQKTPIHRDPSHGSRGSSPASAGGIATTSRQDQRPCAQGGHASLPWPQASSLQLSQMHESRSFLMGSIRISGVSCCGDLSEPRRDADSDEAG